MSKTDTTNQESSSGDFVERRRSALERYLNRTAQHPILRMDPDFREFLEMEEALPKSSNTSAFSSAGVMRLFSKVGEQVNRMTVKMEEKDEVSWSSYHMQYRWYNLTNWSVDCMVACIIDWEWASECLSFRSIDWLIVDWFIDCLSVFLYSFFCFLLQWFEEKTTQVDNMEAQLKKLHASVEVLYHHRRGAHFFFFPGSTIHRLVEAASTINLCFFLPL